ncbi:LysR family transcriptional regulator [Paraburkholderia domus]|uniref:LysR family transcriptional regulator n=1 Tax=Paraburkholderia domus TaxID=2793075 RepID=UPI001B108BF7|nr:LysR family transcriptional regulator [Paraburkholderia domus]CAE6732099.1 HTH-type transcriptional regulator GbpR [Paraburkholderia domus]
MEDSRKRVGRLKMRHLSVIYEIGRTGSLQKASEQLALSQSAISKALTEAETLIGAQLFERTPFGSRATLQGEVLMRYSARVMTDLERAEDECDALSRGESGKLTVGVFTPVGWWEALSRCVNVFGKVAPRVGLTLRQASMEQLLSELDAGDVDLVIGRWIDLDRPGVLRAEPLFHDGGPAFVGRAHHPLVGKTVTLEEMAAFPWFLPEGPSVLLTNLRNVLDAARVPLPHRVIYSHVYTINLAICAHTDTIALLPGFAIDEVGALYGLRRIGYAAPFGTLPLSAIWREDSPGREAAEKFVAELKTICQEGAG